MSDGGAAGDDNDGCNVIKTKIGILIERYSSTHSATEGVRVAFMRWAYINKTASCVQFESDYVSLQNSNDALEQK